MPIRMVWHEKSEHKTLLKIENFSAWGCLEPLVVPVVAKGSGDDTQILGFLCQLKGIVLHRDVQLGENW